MCVGGVGFCLLMVRYFLLTVGVCCLRKLAWSSLLTVEIQFVFLHTMENRFGFLFTFPPLSGDWIWSLLLTAPPS